MTIIIKNTIPDFKYSSVIAEKVVKFFKCDFIGSLLDNKIQLLSDSHD